MSEKFPYSSSSSQIDNIANVNGDVIGVGIDGSGNIIGKNISIVINQAQRYGLTLLAANYFNEHKSTKQDFEDWKKGFSFKLESIKDKMEFRRGIVDDIKTKLENQHILLLSGESGSSKSTILMEIMCEYYDQGYQILFNFGDMEVSGNGIEIVKFIEDLLRAGNKVLVAVDNAHDERTAAIFYVIDHIFNFDLSKNLRFILTARLPEYNWFVKDRLSKVKQEVYIQSIVKLSDNPNFKYNLGPFSKNEVKEFIKKYNPQFSSDKIEKLAGEIYEDTLGYPIMVKFSVLGEGLSQDVREKHDRYLIDPVNMQPDPMKIQTMIVCLLFDIANLPITDKLLDGIGLLEYAYELDRATLYQHSEESWKTIHTRWDLGLLAFMYNESDKRILLKRKEYLKKALDLIFSISDEAIAASIIQTIYDIVALRTIPANIVQSAINQCADETATIPP